MSRLLTDYLRLVLPKWGEQDGIKDPIVFAVFFFPATRWTWFVTEGEQQGDDFHFFGYVIGAVREWGYFSLRELEEVSVGGLRVVSVENFEPKRMSEIGGN